MTVVAWVVVVWLAIGVGGTVSLMLLTALSWSVQRHRERRGRALLLQDLLRHDPEEDAAYIQWLDREWSRT